MKQLKLLGVLAIVLTLGLSGCNKTDEPGDENQAGEQSQVETCEHQWANKKTIKEPTCIEEGQSQRTCKLCGAKEEPKPIAALGHKMKDVAPKTPAGCETKGVMETECERCGEPGEREINPTGHEWSTENGSMTPAQGEGYANFYEYPCAHNCGKKSLGFKANQPTTESKTHLVIGEDGGARFWGRPIGNDVILDEDGSTSQDEHEPVFNDQQEGDFFEYKFDLTAEQAETLKNCRCYCDATPAGYMNQNGIDFWANKAGDEDWTRGMYIDGDHKGEEITDYRYVLYVDDVLQEFDGTPAPVSSDSRAEFEMPFTFHLHQGTNTIRLSMAGGYRSTFYNFYFRAIVAAN